LVYFFQTEKLCSVAGKVTHVLSPSTVGVRRDIGQSAAPNWSWFSIRNWRRQPAR
jgi:hypothetical protein